jgi:hypothetical protein
MNENIKKGLTGKFPAMKYLYPYYQNPSVRAEDDAELLSITNNNDGGIQIVVKHIASNELYTERFQTEEDCIAAGWGWVLQGDRVDDYYPDDSLKDTVSQTDQNTITNSIPNPDIKSYTYESINVKESRGINKGYIYYLSDERDIYYAEFYSDPFVSIAEDWDWEVEKKIRDWSYTIFSGREREARDIFNIMKSEKDSGDILVMEEIYYAYEYYDEIGEYKIMVNSPKDFKKRKVIVTEKNKENINNLKENIMDMATSYGYDWETIIESIAGEIKSISDNKVYFDKNDICYMIEIDGDELEVSEVKELAELKIDESIGEYEIASFIQNVCDVKHGENYEDYTVNDGVSYEEPVDMNMNTGMGMSNDYYESKYNNLQKCVLSEDFEITIGDDILILEKGDAIYFSENIMNEEVDIKKIIKDLQGNFSGSNENQMKGIQLLKGLSTSDEDIANEFMNKLDKATSKISKEVLKEE